MPAQAGNRKPPECFLFARCATTISPHLVVKKKFGDSSDSSESCGTLLLCKWLKIEPASRWSKARRTMQDAPPVARDLPRTNRLSHVGKLEPRKSAPVKMRRGLLRLRAPAFRPSLYQPVPDARELLDASRGILATFLGDEAGRQSPRCRDGRIAEKASWKIDVPASSRLID